MRLFIAIDLPEEWKSQLAEIERSIGWLGKGVKWVRAESLHLTLKFLGETPDQDLPLLQSKLALASKGFKPLALRIEGTGVFPNANRPRVYWVGLQADRSLISLQQNIESAMSDLGFEPEENKFTPHLTVARIKEPIGKQRMTDALLAYKISSEPHTVREILIMRSHLKPEGPQYEAVGRVELRDKG